MANLQKEKLLCDSQLCDSRSAVHQTRSPIVGKTQTRIPRPWAQVPVHLDAVNGSNCIPKSTRLNDKSRPHFPPCVSLWQPPMIQWSTFLNHLYLYEFKFPIKYVAHERYGGWKMKINLSNVVLDSHNMKSKGWKMKVRTKHKIPNKNVASLDLKDNCILILNQI